MNIFVLNCGSSSLKYKMISMPSGEEIIEGEVQRIGCKTAEPSSIVHRRSGMEEIHEARVRSHKEAFSEVMRITKNDTSLLPDVFAHRLVKGGAEFPSSTILKEDDLELLDKIGDLAPIHNPPAVEMIRESARMHPGVPQVMVLDTAFHATIPDYAYTYPLPKSIRQELGIRKYGFHGISHRYVTRETAEFLHIPIEELNAVSCHLGTGGASLCAVVNGKSVDNSMGFSPLQGLVMSTRCGDLDPAVILKMIAYYAGDYSKVNKILNKGSGILGLSGKSSDIRDVIERAAETSDVRSQMALNVYLWRIRKYLGAYLTVVGRADVVIFTDTIGESIPYVREAVCRNMDFFGIKLDEFKNMTISGSPADVAVADSKVHILVVKTNEELEIARQAFELMESGDIRRDETFVESYDQRNAESADEKISCSNS